MSQTKQVTTSKINLAALVIMLTNLLALWEVIPPELETKLVMSINLLTPMLIVVFRTWFTSTKLVWTDDK